MNRGTERMRESSGGGGKGNVYTQDLKIISFLRLIWFIWHEHCIWGEGEDLT